MSVPTSSLNVFKEKCIKKSHLKHLNKISSRNFGNWIMYNEKYKSMRVVRLKLNCVTQDALANAA